MWECRAQQWLPIHAMILPSSPLAFAPPCSLLAFRSKRKLVAAFSELLQRGVSAETPHAIFCRWLEYAQMRIANREMSALVRTKLHLRTAHLCFSALAGMQTRDMLLRYRKAYMVRKNLAALDAWKVKFFMPRLESVWQRRLHAWHARQRRARARAPELRVALAEFRKEVEARVAYEARLLFAWSAQEAVQADVATIAFVPAMLQLRRLTVLRELRRCEALAIAAANAERGTLLDAEHWLSKREAANGSAEDDLDESPALVLFNRLHGVDKSPALSWRMAFRIQRWLFTALSVQLVQLPAAELLASNPAAAFRAVPLPTSAAYWSHIRELLSTIKGHTRRRNEREMMSRGGDGSTTPHSGLSRPNTAQSTSQFPPRSRQSNHGSSARGGAGGASSRPNTSGSMGGGSSALGKLGKLR